MPLFVDSEEEGDFEIRMEDASEDDADSGASDDNFNSDNIITPGNEAEEEVEKSRKRKGKENKAKASKKSKKLGPKQPKGSRSVEALTQEEIKELSAKEYTQYANLYNVQIKEVLEETGIPNKRKQQVLDWLEEFRSFVGGLRKSKKSFKTQDFQKHLHPIQLPLPSTIIVEKKDIQGVVWSPPLSIEIRGSWANDTALSKVSSVDIFLEMPQDYVVKSDILNHRYHLKRSFYLGYLAKRLKKRGDQVNFSLANGESIKPVLSLEVNKVLHILIHAVPPKEYFPLQKLTCERNNVRFDHFFGKAKPEDEPDSSTQHYNFTILEDQLVYESHEQITQFLTDKLQYQDTIKLLKIWLTQRGLLKGYGGFSGFIITQFMRYLDQIGKIRDSMSVFQLLRVFFMNLVQIDLCESGITFSSNSNSDSVRMAHMQWDVVFLDVTGVLNYTANMSKQTYKRIQQEARRALGIIDGANVSGFLALFVTKVDFLLNFDHVICITKLEQLERDFSKRLEDQAVFLNHSGYIYPIAVSSVCSLVEKCLGPRITILDHELPPTCEWNLEECIPRHIPAVIRIGLNINRELSRSLVEKCESDAEFASEKFKEFWGDKAQLRRFMDGTLLESMVLEDLAEGYDLGKSRVCFQMVHHILKRHLNYVLSPEEYIDQQLESLVESKYLQSTGSGGGGSKLPPSKKKVYLRGKLVKPKFVKPEKETTEVSVDHVTSYISNCFDELSKTLRQLEELPLQISTVQGTSSVLRFSNIQPTPPQTYFGCKVLTKVGPKTKAMMLRKSVPVNVKAPLKNANSKNQSLKSVPEQEQDGDDDDEEDAEAEVEEEEIGESKTNEKAKTKEVLIQPSKVPKYVEPVGVILHLETSGKWPDNMEAIERLKCAFLIKIGQLLTQKFGLTVQPHARHLDVLRNGVVFRIRITYLRELTLLRQICGADGIHRIRDNLESLKLEKETLILPQLTSTLHSFHLQHEAFGKTCRLAKRWVASQLLLSSPLEYTNRSLEEPDSRLTEESVELLVAHLFLNYAPHLNFPNEAQVGFQRFLSVLANTDFRVVPIILNFNDKLTPQDIAQIEVEFVKMRTTLPSLFISTPFDKKGSVWTKALSPVILGRVQLLAKQALSLLKEKFEISELTPKGGIDPMKIFKAGTAQFDVIIRLKPKMNSRSFQNLEKVETPLTFQEYKKQVEEYIPIVEFDPVQMYLAELRNAFGHLAIFLHDLFGGQFIAVVWKPDAFKPCSFTGSSVKGRQLGKDRDSIVANVSGILEGFEIMGEGLVEKVCAQTDRWKFED